MGEIRAIKLVEFVKHLTEMAAAESVIEFNDEDSDVRFLPFGLIKSHNEENILIINVGLKASEEIKPIKLEKFIADLTDMGDAEYTIEIHDEDGDVRFVPYGFGMSAFAENTFVINVWPKGQPTE